MIVIKHTIKIPASLEKCWDFFSSPINLKTITPGHLGFKITNEMPAKMYPGQIIAYKISPFKKFTCEWITEITHIEEPHYFIDEQRFGPYKFWHHEHHFKPILNGTEMTDIVYFKMPYGALGKMLYHVKVKHDLKKIFSYRKTKIEEIFGIYRGLVA